MPRVTVLLTVYNGERYLHQAIDSILDQTFQDFELLIINDGSTDGSPAVIRSYTDPRIRTIHNQRNLGRTKALNLGLEAARGTYVAIQDADDVSEPERLALQVGFLDLRPEVALVGAPGIVIDGHSRCLGPYPIATPTRPIDIHWELLFLNPLIQSAVMMHREIALFEMGGYDTRYLYAQDYDLWSRLSFHHPLAGLTKRLVRYRAHAESMGQTYTKRSHAEPAAINRRNLQYVCPNLNHDEIDVLNVLGRGAKKLPKAYPVKSAIELYHIFVAEYITHLPHHVTPCDGLETWRKEQALSSFLNLADAYIFQGSRRQALRVLWLIWRLDPLAVRACGRSLVKIAAGRRLSRLLRKSRDFLHASDTLIH